MPIRNTSGISIGPDRSSFACKVGPAMYSMTRYGIGCSSTAWMLTTLAWRMAAAARASRRNRFRGGEVAASPRAITLMATIRCSFSSNARTTVPNPPRPTTSSTS